ncbi:MAG: hypothetical protein CVU41_17405, partial [Chloroflexi bacterium HGW-Chloroflexi-3]
EQMAATHGSASVGVMACPYPGAWIGWGNGSSLQPHGVGTSLGKDKPLPVREDWICRGNPSRLPACRGRGKD